MSLVYSTMYIEGGPVQTLFSPCSDHVLLIGKGGVVGIYPAADDMYTFVAERGEDRESYEILVDISEEVNSWGVSESREEGTKQARGIRDHGSSTHGASRRIDRDDPPTRVSPTSQRAGTGFPDPGDPLRPSLQSPYSLLRL